MRTTFSPVLNPAVPGSGVLRDKWRMPLTDTVDASPAIIGDQIYLRGRKYLYCIAEDKSGKPEK